jgi:hypothetical protein
MRCERIRDQDTLRTQDDDSTVQTMPPLNEISLNCIERFEGRNGCNGRGDEFYGYTRLQQWNNTSTGHVRDEYGGQFGKSLGQHRVNSLGGHRVNTVGGHRVTTLGGHRVTTLGGHRVTTLGGHRVTTFGGARINTL